MGKSSRIRANRAKHEVKSLNAKKQKKGMPNWLMTTLALVITLAILLSVVGLLLSANGVFNRWAKTISTKHFKVNANMLSYYYQTQYQNFLNEQSNTLSYFSLDTSKSLKDQRFGGPENPEEGEMYYDAIFLGEYEGTWFDFFMDQTVESVSSLLVYCESAYERGIELDDKDQEQIDANLTSLGAAASSYGYPSVDSYISAVYGDGVKEKDVRKAMEYSALATKCMAAISDEIEATITDTQINDAYNADPKKFNSVDYSYYTFSVNYLTVQKEVAGSDATVDEITAKKDEILSEYRKQIADAKLNATKLTQLATKEEVDLFVLTQLAKKEIKDLWTQQTIDLGDKANQLALIQETLATEIARELLANQTSSESAAEDLDAIKALNLDTTVLGKLTAVKESAFAAALSSKTTYLCENVAFSETNEFLTWAFDGKVDGDTNIVMKGDGSAEGEINNTDGYFSASAYFLAKAPYRNNEKTKNVAYMLFTSEDAATSVIKAMTERGNIDLAAFEALATEFGAETNAHLENYVEGSLKSTVFDEWLFAKETTLGTYTVAPLKLDQSTFCVALYYGEGNENWYITVKNQILSDQFDATAAEMTVAYPVTVKEKALDRVTA